MFSSRLTCRIVVITNVSLADWRAENMRCSLHLSGEVLLMREQCLTFHNCPSPAFVIRNDDPRSAESAQAANISSSRQRKGFRIRIIRSQAVTVHARSCTPSAAVLYYAHRGGSLSNTSSKPRSAEFWLRKLLLLVFPRGFVSVGAC